MNTAVVIAARRGDREAYARLVKHHANSICSLSFAITGEFAQAEEIAQQVYW